MLEKPKSIQLELFPASIAGVNTDLQYDEVLAVVTDANIYLATDDPTGRERYAIVYESPIYDITGSGFRSTWTVTLDDDKRTELIITRSRGCGCGSRLKGVRLFRGVPYARII